MPRWRPAGGHSLLLDGGDVNTGVPESDLLDAEPDFKAMVLLGYDAMAVGNHEFDKPPAVLAQAAPVGQLPAAVGQHLPGRAADAFEPFRIFERGGYKIAVMGLTTDDTTKHGAARQHPRPQRSASRPTKPRVLVPQLRARADMVIAATHMGHFPDRPAWCQCAGRRGDGAGRCRGIDLIVGGHSQNPVCMLAENIRITAYRPGEPCAPDRQNGAWIVQAHEWGKYVGRADFVIDGGRVNLVKYQLIPVNLKQTGPDGKKVVIGEAIPKTRRCAVFCCPSTPWARSGCWCRWARPTVCSTATATACAASPPHWAR